MASIINILNYTQPQGARIKEKIESSILSITII